jgi:membrane protein
MLAVVGRPAEGVLGTIIGTAALIFASFTMTTVLFAMMFRWLPDIAIGWREFLPGSILTAL